MISFITSHPAAFALASALALVLSKEVVNPAESLILCAIKFLTAVVGLTLIFATTIVVTTQ